ncbi:coiled-coil-helix-coiled-coil-helix domain-containing protein 2-like [Haliotis rufescens]|uniref:coiled-coil-helix-coiled-coil-helix domain-containing protein 2-like n=1 Tax=Haliotis rufescens TaxID=6454 RepID=UPI00201E8AB5|nr:coiled-coil-helix-coiled-coil-helix domain-containing protein 2-like [Haliotis rufescens]
MPRRGRMSSPAPRRPVSQVPAQHHAPPPPAPVHAQPRQPGLMAQMATTAAGVAVGSAVGHTIGAAMTGGMGGGNAPAPQQETPQPLYQQQQQQQQSAGPCQVELKQFLDCANNQSDLSLCFGFNEALRQCKLQNGTA